MDDALVVRGLEAFDDLLCDRDRLVRLNRPALQPLREILAVDELLMGPASVRPTSPSSP
jgi:hypothetical protein